MGSAKQDRMYIRRTKKYDVYHYPGPRGGEEEYTNYHTGIAIAPKNRLLADHNVTKIYVPPDEVRGRGGALRVKRTKDTDFLFMDMYLAPSKDGNAKYDHGVEPVLDWGSEVLQDQAERTRPRVRGNLNASIGPPTL